MTIKETAGKLLLYFYQLQRTAPLTMAHRQFGFVDKKTGNGVILSSDKKAMAKDLFDINPSSTDILNAFNFLLDKDYVDTRERVTAGARVFVGMQVTVKGIDVIEGVEGGADGVKDFERAFNIRVGSNATVDSVVRSQLKALIG